MGRSPRIERYGTIYQISIEGKWDIFKTEEDKIKILEILEEVKEKSDFLILAYSILDNRYDFVIKCHNIPISKCMQKTNMAYTRYYNSKHNLKGTPYKGRYKSIVIEDERNLINYIWKVHRLPIENNLTTSLEEYKWTSDVLYKFNLESIVDIRYILNDLDDDRNKAIEKYIQLMEQEDMKNHIDDRDNSSGLNEILKQVCNNNHDFNLIKSGSRKSYLTEFKKEYILRSKEEGFKNNEIGKNIGITERAVRKHL